MKNYRVLTKKEIKELKRQITEDGILNIGYYHKLHNELSNINFEKLIESTGKLVSDGFDYNSIYFLDCLVVEFCKNITYQEFKKVVPYLVGRTHYKLINNQLVSTEVF